MRRGRILAAAAGTLAAALVAVSAASAATPRQIYADLAAHGRLTKHYSAADLRRASLDASVQGYGGVQVQTLRPVVNQVAGANKTLRSPSGAPLGATHVSGTLPFTGLQLGVFLAVGLALLGGGLLVRRLSRSRA